MKIYQVFVFANLFLLLSACTNGTQSSANSRDQLELNQSISSSTEVSYTLIPTSTISPTDLIVTNANIEQMIVVEGDLPKGWYVSEYTHDFRAPGYIADYMENIDYMLSARLENQGEFAGYISILKEYSKNGDLLTGYQLLEFAFKQASWDNYTWDLPDSNYPIILAEVGVGETWFSYGGYLWTIDGTSIGIWVCGGLIYIGFNGVFDPELVETFALKLAERIHPFMCSE